MSRALPGIALRQALAGIALLACALLPGAHPAAAQSADDDVCSDRLLVAGSEAVDAPAALWWFWPDDGRLRRVETDEQRAYLVALSPDGQWVSYYQRSPSAPADRFVVDTWVMNVATDERFKLADTSTPVAWTADSQAVVLGERPNVMVAVPGGQTLPTQGDLVSANSMRTAAAPDGSLQAIVASTPDGISGIELVDRGSGDVVLEVPTGRAAVQLAWSPDATRLAYTNASQTADGLLWRLRLLDVAAHRVEVPAATRDMELYSVVWVPPLPSCAALP